MKKPTNKEELFRIITEQEKQIQSIRQAMMRMEQKLQKLVMEAERSRGKTFRLKEENQILAEHIRIIEAKLAR